MKDKEYKKLTSSLLNGDIILIRRKRLLSTLIRKYTNTTYSHIGIAVKKGNMWFYIDSNEDGVKIKPLERVFQDWSGYLVLTPLADFDERIRALNEIEKLCIEKTNYDFLLFIRTAIKIAIRKDFKFLNSKGFMCTELVLLYLSLLNIHTDLLPTSLSDDFIDISDLKQVL